MVMGLGLEPDAIVATALLAATGAALRCRTAPRRTRLGQMAKLSTSARFDFVVDREETRSAREAPGRSGLMRVHRLQLLWLCCSGMLFVTSGFVSMLIFAASTWLRLARCCWLRSRVGRVRLDFVLVERMPREFDHWARGPARSGHLDLEQPQR